MPVPLGLDGKLYRNSATWATPTWNEVDNVRDLTQNLEKGEADLSARNTGGFRARRGTLKDGTIEFGMNFDPADPEFTAIKDAFFNNTVLDMAAMSGDITTTGEQGLRAEMDVLNFSRNENLEEGMTVDVSLAVAPPQTGQTPTWFEVP